MHTGRTALDAARLLKRIAPGGNAWASVGSGMLESTLNRGRVTNTGVRELTHQVIEGRVYVCVGSVRPAMGFGIRRAALPEAPLPLRLVVSHLQPPG